MKRILKSFWGCIPITVFLILIVLLVVIQIITDNTLRIAPRNILILLGIICFGILLLWGNLKYVIFRKEIRDNKNKFAKYSSIILYGIVSVFIMFCIVLAGLFIIGFSRKTENVITRNEITMVACGDSFSDEEVYYYQYKNSFFYGKELGYEYYGGDDEVSDSPLQWFFYDLEGNIIEKGENGKVYNVLSDDIKAEILDNEKKKFLQEKADIEILDIKVMNNSEYGQSFSISINDYIDSYNGYYWEEEGKRYLPPAAYWDYAAHESGDGLNYETNYYHFTEDEKIRILPAVSVHTLKNGENIKQIVLDFDDHSYSEEMYAKYEETCFYTLKVFFPDLDDDKIAELYKEINDLAYKNIFPKEQGYNSDNAPCALYHRNGIGVYPYFAVGERVRFCIIPVTSEIISEFAAAGSKIYNIS